jgi:cysteine synthase A
MANDVLSGIGNTPLVELRNVVPAGSARIVVKLEWANPTGSMKDRMAQAAIAGAERSGRLRAGGTVVEATMGTTGISLAFICAAKGYRMEVVFSDAFSVEKRATMQAFGAHVTEVPSDRRQITEALVREMTRTAAVIGDRPEHWYCDQLNNPDAITGYLPLGEELWQQTAGQLTAFVQSVSTGHSIHGVTEALWRHSRKIQIVAVEPAESPVLSGGRSGAHRIEGIGIGYLPPLWRPELVNDIYPVTTAEAVRMARRLAREEGIFAGTSSGANVVAALRPAADLGPGATVATLIVDSGLRYLSTELYAGATPQQGGTCASTS